MRARKGYLHVQIVEARALLFHRAHRPLCQREVPRTQDFVQREGIRVQCATGRSKNLVLQCQYVSDQNPLSGQSALDTRPRQRVALHLGASRFSTAGLGQCRGLTCRVHVSGLGSRVVDTCLSLRVDGRTSTNWKKSRLTGSNSSNSAINRAEGLASA
eukprot:1693046-Rhodomonas_salina.4